MHRYNISLSDECNDYLVKIGSVMSVKNGCMWSLSDAITFCVLELISQNFILKIDDGNSDGKRD